MRDCEVSYYRLLAAPEVLEGHIVGLTGYLASDFGVLVLYPDAVAFQGRRHVESLVLEPPFSIPEDLLDEVRNTEGVYPVFVYGRFRPEHDAPTLAPRRLGALHDIRKILAVPQVISREPLDMHGISVEKIED